MAEDDALVKPVERFLAEKEALVAKEKALIESLNSVLARMGYQVTPLKKAASAPAGPSTGRRGRPPGSSTKKPSAD